MKAKITLFILGFFLLGVINSQAQLLQTKDNIIKENGTPDDTGVADDGSDYIVYLSEDETKASGKYTSHKVIYFVELENGLKICNLWKIYEPSTETNSFISFFKENYVQTDYMEYKDYENKILYNVKVDDGYCIVTASFNDTK